MLISLRHAEGTSRVEPEHVTGFQDVLRWRQMQRLAKSMKLMARYTGPNCNTSRSLTSVAELGAYALDVGYNGLRELIPAKDGHQHTERQLVDAQTKRTAPRNGIDFAGRGVEHLESARHSADVQAVAEWDRPTKQVPELPHTTHATLTLTTARWLHTSNTAGTSVTPSNSFRSCAGSSRPLG